MEREERKTVQPSEKHGATTLAVATINLNKEKTRC